MTYDKEKFDIATHKLIQSKRLLNQVKRLMNNPDEEVKGLFNSGSFENITLDERILTIIGIIDEIQDGMVKYREQSLYENQ